MFVLLCVSVCVSSYICVGRRSVCVLSVTVIGGLYLYVCLCVCVSLRQSSSLSVSLSVPVYRLAYIMLTYACTIHKDQNVFELLNRHFFTYCNDLGPPPSFKAAVPCDFLCEDTLVCHLDPLHTVCVSFPLQ